MRAFRSRLGRPGGVLLIALTLAACGGGGSSGPSESPVISNLRVTPLDPERAGTTIRYLLAADYFDVQADVFNGTCEFTGTLVRSPVSPGPRQPRSTS
jgi:hypothetical protein